MCTLDDNLSTPVEIVHLAQADEYNGHSQMCKLVGFHKVDSHSSIGFPEKFDRTTYILICPKNKLIGLAFL